MKKPLLIFAGVLLFLRVVMVLRAQLATTTSQSIGTMSDLEVMVLAVEQTTPLPASEVPDVGNFYSTQHLPGTENAWPPLPGNIWNFPAWPLGNGYYLLDDVDMDYDALAAAAAPTTMSMMLARSLAMSHDYGDSVYLTNLMANPAGDGTMTASFSIAGGTNLVPYDILMSTNLATPFSDWTWIGIGYTSDNYTFSEQPADNAFYVLAKPSKALVIAWGNNDGGQCNVPLDLTNAIEVTGGARHSIALLNNGNVVAWGDNTYGQTNVPADLTNAVVVVANVYHNLALRADGSLAIWGKWQSNSVAFYDVSLPSDLTNITAIAAGPDYDLAVRSDGSVVAWGSNDVATAFGNVVTNLPPAMDMAAGVEHAVALLTDGTVTAWGENYVGENETNVPAGLSNVVAIAAGDFHTLALKSDGTVVAWGAGTNSDGYFINHGQSIVPGGLSNVVAIAAGGYHSLALKSDGTMVVWGDYTNPGFPLNQIIGIGSGWMHVLALRTGNTVPLITGQPADQYAPAGQTVSFSVSAIGLATVEYQWQSNGVAISGATSSTLTLTNVQAADEAAYNVVVTSSDTGGSVVSSNASFYLITPPVIISQSPLPTNYAAFFQSPLTLHVTADAPGQTNGFPLSYQWQFSGTNVGYGSSSYTFSAVNPGEYKVIVSNAAGTATAGWQLNVIIPGNAWAWGENTYGESTLPTGASNFIAIAAGGYQSVAVRDDGTLVQWGDYWQGDTNFTPVGSPPAYSNLVAVSAGIDDTIALKSDGTVVQWGLTDSPALANFPTNLTGVKAISAGWYRNLALLTNGTIVDWGFFAPVFNFDQRVPSDLTNATAIACGAYHNLAVRGDGTVESWGYNDSGQTNVPTGLSNVVAVAGGEKHSLALKADGTVVAWGDDSDGQCDVPLGLSNVMAIAAGDFHSLALKNDGTVVAWGDDSDGQTDPPTLSHVKLIAAGGDHNLAVIFSPTVMYPVDVSRDLLLIYNSNSSDSSNVCAYYLAHRPMVSGANVLGMACDVGEFFTSSNNCDAQLVTPVLNWLTNNPTKHPEYIVLFYDIPTRLSNSYPYYAYGSISYHLQQSYPGLQPFVNNINAGSAADCEAYVDKLEFFGTNYSPGRLIINASAGEYGNANYYFDDTEIGYLGYGAALAAVEGVTANGTSSNSIIYTNVYPDCGSLACHITGGTNVAGYLCWGAHSSLGDDYAVNTNKLQWFGNSGWWIIKTIESNNGKRISDQGNFIQWFSSNAFGGTNFSNTPVGAICNVEEPGGADSADNYGSIYFGLWSAGKNAGICAWNAINSHYFEAIGDPLVTK
jgi:alpha-tubulin suppressor-like RCC1 family protein